MIKKIIFTILSILLGAVFIFSGYTKLYPVELFEATFVDIGVSSWATAPYLARIMIGFEFLIGLLLIFNLYFNKTTLKLTIFVLALFTIYLFILMLVEGNKGNCKCFGDYLVFTPLESIVKNIIMIIVAILLYIFHKGFKIKFQKWILILFIVVSLVMPFILNPVDAMITNQMQPEAVNYDLDLSCIPSSPKNELPKIDLLKGKHIIVFASLTCPHCKVGGYKIHVINKKNPEIPFYFFLNGDNEKLRPFFDETQIDNIPHSMLFGECFVELGGLQLPQILLVNNGKVEKKLNYLLLNQNEIESWIKN